MLLLLMLRWPLLRPRVPSIHTEILWEVVRSWGGAPGMGSAPVGDPREPLGPSLRAQEKTVSVNGQAGSHHTRALPAPWPWTLASEPREGMSALQAV